MDSKVREDTAVLAGRRSPKKRRVGVDSTSTGAAPSSAADNSTFSRLSSDVLLAMAKFADFRDVARLARCSRYLRTTLTLDLNASPPSRVVSALRCCEMNLDGCPQPESLVLRLLATATRLETLALHTSSLPENALPANAFPMTLHTLALHGPNLLEVLKLIAPYSHLRSLSLGSTTVANAEVLSTLPSLSFPALRELALRFNMSAPVSHFLTLLKAAPDLQSIRVDRIFTQSDAFIEALTRMKNLQRLWLDDFVGDSYCFWIGLLPRIESLRELTFGRNFPRAINATHMPDQITHLRCLPNISNIHPHVLRNLQQLHIECPGVLSGEDHGFAQFELTKLGDCLPLVHTLTIEFTAVWPEPIDSIVGALHKLCSVSVWRKPPLPEELVGKSLTLYEFEQYEIPVSIKDAQYATAGDKLILPALQRVVVKARVAMSSDSDSKARIDAAIVALRRVRPSCEVTMKLAAWPFDGASTDVE